MALDFLSSTKKKIIDMSAALAGASQAADPQVDMFSEKLSELVKVVTALRLDLAKYAESMITSASQSSRTGLDFVEIYRHSEARQKSLMTFSATMHKIELLATGIWTNTFNYEVLGMLDQWTHQLNQLIRQSKNLQKMFAKVTQANQSKTESPSSLAQMQSDYEHCRNELKEIVKKHLESRYTVLDAILVRLMELQIEYLTKSASTVSQLEKNVESYRKRFPKGSIPEILQVQPSYNIDDKTSISEQSKQPVAQRESEDESTEEDDTEDEKVADDDHNPTLKQTTDRSVPKSNASSNGRPVESKVEPSHPIDLLFGFDANMMNSDSKPKAENAIPFESMAPSAAPSTNSIDHLFSSIPVDTTPLASFPFSATFISANDNTSQDFLYTASTDVNVPEHGHDESNQRIRNLRANLHPQAEENLNDAKNRAKDNVSFQLDSWEFSLGQKRKNIRMLLSTVHTVLPADMNFTSISITDLQTATGVKKAMRKAVLCVHPDKVDVKSPNGAVKLVICERVFNAIQIEYKAFEDSGS